MSNHHDYQPESTSGHQQVVMGHMDPNLHEQEQEQMDKYFKYSHPSSVAHSSLTPQNVLDSNHNYASDLRYYNPPPSQIDMSNSQCLVDEQNKDSQCSAIGHGMEHYHPSMDVPKYPEQHQQQQPQAQQVQNMEHVAKADDDFSVILADVRKTCYSS